MSELAYIVNSLAWSGVGFLLGWHVARLRRDINRAIEKGNEHDADSQS